MVKALNDSNCIIPDFDYLPEQATLFNDYVLANEGEFYSKHGFAKYLDINRLVEMFSKCTPAQMNEVRSAFLSIYRIVNVREFFLEDLSAISALLHGMELTWDYDRLETPNGSVYESGHIEYGETGLGVVERYERTVEILGSLTKTRTGVSKTYNKNGTIAFERCDRQEAMFPDWDEPLVCTDCVTNYDMNGRKISISYKTKYEYKSFYKYDALGRLSEETSYSDNKITEEIKYEYIDGVKYGYVYIDDELFCTRIYDDNGYTYSLKYEDK